MSDQMFDFDNYFNENNIDINELIKSSSEEPIYDNRLLLGYKKLNPDAKDPNYVYKSDSGFDLYSTEESILPPFGRKAIPTGLSFDIRDGYEIQVRPKSGLALNQGLTVLNTPGTVDSGYDGEVKVIVFNTNPTEVKIDKGMKIAQAVLCPVVNGNWVRLELIKEIKDKDRGDNGFGSTGIK